MTEPHDARARALTAAAAASSKKADDIVILEVGEILAIADEFVIVSGANDRQVKAIVEAIEERLKHDLDVAPLRIEGLAERRWVLMDYGDVWVHVFDRETRAYYELERLWSDAPRVAFEDPAAGAAVS